MCTEDNRDNRFGRYRGYDELNTLLLNINPSKCIVCKNVPSIINTKWFNLPKYSKNKIGNNCFNKLTLKSAKLFFTHASHRYNNSNNCF